MQPQTLQLSRVDISVTQSQQKMNIKSFTKVAAYLLQGYGIAVHYALPVFITLRLSPVPYIKVYSYALPLCTTFKDP